MYVASPCSVKRASRRERERGAERVSQSPVETPRSAAKTKTDAFAHRVSRKKTFLADCSLVRVDANTRSDANWQRAQPRRNVAKKPGRPIGALSAPRRGVRRDRRRVSVRTRERGDTRDPARAESSRAAGSVKRRDTYLEALGQGVVAGEVGLEPHLGLDVRAGSVLGRLARAAAAAAAMVEVGRCVSVATSGTVVRRAAVARDRRARPRERPHRPKIRSARDVAVDRLVDLMTLGA